MISAYELAVRQSGREAARQAEQRRSYELWATAKAGRDVRDRANRRIMWRVVAVASMVVLGTLGFAIWQVVRALAGHADTVIGGAALVIAVCVFGPVLVGGGCKTVITIWHSHR